MRPAQPRKEALRSPQASALSGDGHRLAGWPCGSGKDAAGSSPRSGGDFLRVMQIAFLRPAEEGAQRPLVHFKGLGRVVALIEEGEPGVNLAGQRLRVAAIKAVGLGRAAASFAAGAHPRHIADSLLAAHPDSICLRYDALRVSAPLCISETPTGCTDSASFCTLDLFLAGRQVPDSLPVCPDRFGS